jgi:hypothetical protein
MISHVYRLPVEEFTMGSFLPLWLQLNGFGLII